MKPRGYSTVSPYLVVRDARGLADFLVNAFDATRLRWHEHEDGSILHAEVRIGDTVVMLGDADPAWTVHPALLHMYVDDVESAMRRAVEAGGVRSQEPDQKDGDPDVRGGIVDPAGNTWAIASPRPRP